MNQREEQKTPEEELAEYIARLLLLTKEYKSGKITKGECLQKLIPIMDAFDFKSTSSYLPVVH
jgi:hypothetical protein